MKAKRKLQEFSEALNRNYKIKMILIAEGAILTTSKVLMVRNFTLLIQEDAVNHLNV